MKIILCTLLLFSSALFGMQEIQELKKNRPRFALATRLMLTLAIASKEIETCKEAISKVNEAADSYWFYERWYWGKKCGYGICETQEIINDSVQQIVKTIKDENDFPVSWKLIELLPTLGDNLENIQKKVTETAIAHQNIPTIAHIAKNYSSLLTNNNIFMLCFSALKYEWANQESAKKANQILDLVHSAWQKEKKEYKFAFHDLVSVEPSNIAVPLDWLEKNKYCATTIDSKGQSALDAFLEASFSSRFKRLLNQNTLDLLKSLRSKGISFKLPTKGLETVKKLADYYSAYNEQDVSKVVIKSLNEMLDKDEKLTWINSKIDKI